MREEDIYYFNASNARSLSTSSTYSHFFGTLREVVLEVENAAKDGSRELKVKKVLNTHTLKDLIDKGFEIVEYPRENIFRYTIKW